MNSPRSTNDSTAGSGLSKQVHYRRNPVLVVEAGSVQSVARRPDNRRRPHGFSMGNPWGIRRPDAVAPVGQTDSLYPVDGRFEIGSPVGPATRDAL